MLFNSIDFVILVLIAFTFYYVPWFRPYQVIILILSSFVFYAYNSPYLLTLLIASALINSLTSFFVMYYKQKRLFASIGVIINLLILCSFKYTKLLFYTFFDEANTVSSIDNIITSIPLPIGISFFTFQGISLIIDVFRKQKNKQYELLKINQKLIPHLYKSFLFICFFPQLVAGPIVKAHEFFPQIKSKYFSEIDLIHVYKSLVTGYFLKMVVADNLKDQTFWIAYPYFEGLSSTTLVTMLFAYSMQIFSDFAGYSLIAIGIASLFGYRLPKNFNFPYISQSFSEFWRRWHISLSTWLRDYLYFPLGGNRNGSFNTYRNLFLVMFLGGLWHGAAWSYAAWGTWHGLALAIERRFRSNSIKTIDNMPIRLLKIVLVFSFVSISWMFFKLNDFSHVVAFVFTLFNNTDLHQSWLKITMCLTYSLPIICYHLYYLTDKNTNLLSHKYDFSSYSFLLLGIVLNSGDPGDFIYFQF